MDLNELINKAIESQRQGIPVDWQSLCITCTNVASNVVQQKDDEIASLQDELASLQDELDPSTSHDESKQP